ncbi:MAG TPA: 2-phosphosulfolactate phosphatase [Segetibacter sp.]|nr:2-phosphosulfolactate phosphatase [Segetibacter sp.]
MSKKPTLFTSLSPALLHLTNLKHTVVVIIDVFRATSTIATALFNGAEKVIPVAGVEECKRLGSEIPNAVTAGEREGRVIEGLQYGNSPAEYPREFIEGKTLVLTTTNGTKLLHMAFDRGCDSVVTGSFPNLSAVCQYLVSSNKDVVLGCSGWKDMFNLEDTLFAGAVIDRIKEHFVIHDDASLMAQQIYRLHESNLFKFIQNTTHWHRLAAYGLQKDLQYCISIDVANVLPVYQNGELIALP